MSDATVPAGHGYAEIPLGSSRGKAVQSIHFYQNEEMLNIDLEFNDQSLLEMVFRVGFQSSIKLLDRKDGEYRLRRRIKPKLRDK